MFKISLKLSNVLFYSALCFAEAGWMLTNVNFISKFCGLFINLSIVLLLICFIVQSKVYYAKTLFISGLLVLSVMITTQNTEDVKLFILVVLFCISAKRIEVYDAIDFFWKLQLLLIIIVSVLYFLGFTSNYYMLRSDGTVRSSVGFSHPNAFGKFVFSFFSSFVYSNISKIKSYYLIIIGIFLSFIVYHLSDSRTSVFAFLLLDFFLILKNFLDKKNIILSRKIKVLLASIPIFLDIFSVLVAKYYDRTSELMYKINLLLSGRIGAAARIVNSYNIKLFGQKLDLITTKEAIEKGLNPLVLDNAYLKMLYQYGVLLAFIFIIFYTYISYFAILKNDYLLFFILMTFSFIGLFENTLFNFSANIFLLFFAQVLYGGKIKSVKSTFR